MVLGREESEGTAVNIPQHTSVSSCEIFGAPLFSEIVFCVASCSYIYITSTEG